MMKKQDFSMKTREELIADLQLWLKKKHNLQMHKIGADSTVSMQQKKEIRRNIARIKTFLNIKNRDSNE